MNTFEAAENVNSVGRRTDIMPPDGTGFVTFNRKLKLTKTDGDGEGTRKTLRNARLLGRKGCEIFAAANSKEFRPVLVAIKNGRLLGPA